MKSTFNVALAEEKQQKKINIDFPTMQKDQINGNIIGESMTMTLIVINSIGIIKIKLKINFLYQIQSEVIH